QLPLEVVRPDDLRVVGLLGHAACQQEDTDQYSTEAHPYPFFCWKMPASHIMYFTCRIGMMMTSLGVSISRISMSSLMVCRTTLLYTSSSLSVRTTRTQYSTSVSSHVGTGIASNSLAAGFAI